MPTPSAGEVLHRLMHGYKRTLRNEHLKHGITLPVSHIRTLKVIQHFQGKTDTPCTAQLIVQTLERDKAQIARVIKELLAEHLIVRRNNPQDRRSHALSLTETGTEMLSRIFTAEAAAGSTMFTGLETEQVDTFIALTNQIIDNLSQHQEL